MKIANKINISFFVVVAILTAIAMSIFYMAGKINLEKAIYAHLSTTAHSRAHHIDTFLKTQKNAATQLSKSIVLEEFLTFLKTQKNAATQLSKSIVLEEFLSAGKEDPDYIQRFNRAMRRLKATEKANEFTSELFVIDKNGKIAASSDRSKIGSDKSTDSYFLGGKKGPYIKDAYYSETMAKKCLVFSAPIKDSNTGEFLGVIVARVGLDMLNEITTDRTGLGKTGDIYLINKYGYMITPSRFAKDTFLKLKVDTENTRKFFEDLQKFDNKSHQHEAFIYRNYNGVKVLGIHDHIHNMQWCLCAEIDEREALAPLAIIKLISIIIFCAVLGTVWTIGTLVSRVITAPIHRLHKGTEIIGQGNLDYKVGTDVKDEIGQLSQAFDKMTDNLKQSTTSIDSLNKEITERKKAEEALQESEEKFKLIYETSSDAIMIVKPPTWRFTSGNSAIVKMFGVKNEKEFISLRPWEVSPKYQPDGQLSVAKAKKMIETAMKKGKNFFEWTHQTVQGKSFFATVLLNRIEMKGKAFLQARVTDITERKQAEAELKATQEKLIETAHRAGMAEVAADVLHNVGNVLNSINVSTTVIKEKVTSSEVANLEKVANIINEHSDDLGTFLTEHPQGKHIPVYLTEVSKTLTDEQTDIIDKLKVLVENVQHIKEIVGMQQSYAKVSGVEVQTSLSKLAEDAIQINSAGLERHGAQLIREFEELGDVEIDKQKVLQILVNLISNAKYALSDSSKEEKLLTIRIYKHSEERFRVEVADNGVGISEDNLAKIFSYGFTTKKDGHGVGLHSSALAAKEIGGSLTVYSDGLGQGATFTLELPFKTVEVMK